MRKLGLLCAGLILAVGTTVWGATVRVGPGQSVQGAIDAASNGDIVMVAPGSYNESIDLKGKGIELISEGGAAVTMFDAMGTSTVLRCTSGETATTRIVGFTITGGEAIAGGGMLVDGSSPTVEACVFTSNSATNGGGLHVRGSSQSLVIQCEFRGNDAGFGGAIAVRDGATPLIIDCVLAENRAQFGGGMEARTGASPRCSNVLFEQNVATTGSGAGLYVNDSLARIIGCRFEGNIAQTLSGGGLISIDSDMRATSCSFVANVAEGNGGGAYSSGGAPRYVNCVFELNTAMFGGGLYNVDQSEAEVINCTVVANVATSTGGGIISLFGSTTRIVNSIAWANVPDQIIDFQTVSTVDHSCVEGGWTGAGSSNIVADPRLIDIAGGDVRIASTSPCLDAGDDEGLPPDVDDIDGDGNTLEPIPLDIANAARTRFAAVDMGAYESVTSFCGTDLDDNDRIGFSDLVILLNDWGACNACTADFDRDGRVSFNDLILLLGSWGPCLP